MVRLALSIVAGTLLVGTLGMSSASAAVAPPPHGGSVECREFSNQVDIKETIAGYSWTHYEYGYVFLRFQMYHPWERAWANIDVPGVTDRWLEFVVSRGYGQQTSTFHVGPNSNGIYLPDGFHYRVVSWFYWPSTGYMTPAEISSSCYLLGLQVNYD